MDENWAPMMEDLADALLAWKYSSDTGLESTVTGYEFTIDVIDLYTLKASSLIPRSDTQSAQRALVMNGFLGSTPLSPSLAVSLKTLELLRKIRLCKPSFSIEAFAKVLCDLYNVCAMPRYYISPLTLCLDAFPSKIQSGPVWDL